MPAGMDALCRGAEHAAAWLLPGSAELTGRGTRVERQTGSLKGQHRRRRRAEAGNAATHGPIPISRILAVFRAMFCSRSAGH